MKRLFYEAAMSILLLIPSAVGAQVTLTAQTTQVTQQAQAVQTIRGQVCDVASGEPMAGVTITVENGITMGTVSDADGNFVIENVPVGRHSVRATFIGYEPVVLKEQLLSSGKEMVLNLRMRENISELGEVVVKPRVNKQMPLNEMAQVGARMFSVEEATRYAGGMADPARTASMFAGVATGGATNGISIHGNSPQMLQWRVEGVEVNNPNHFAEITEAGGGIFIYFLFSWFFWGFQAKSRHGSGKCWHADVDRCYWFSAVRTELYTFAFISAFAGYLFFNGFAAVGTELESEPCITALAREGLFFLAREAAVRAELARE